MNYGGNVDYFYEKFTSPKAKSMIIGDSRSFQGIQPHIMNQYFESKGFDVPVLNYSFTIAQAIIGPLYNESIFKKLDTATKNGIFVISITPEMLTTHDNFNDEEGEFREAGQPPHNMNFVSINPNYEYLIKNISLFHFKAVFRQKSKVHKNGWLEETNLPTDKAVYEEWKDNQISLFLRDVEKYKISRVRMQSLSNLIQKLKHHGNVFLIRMPIGNDFLGYERKYFPNFENLVDSIAKVNSIKYYDFNTYEKKYNTYDGHHIDKFSGKEFTTTLCDSIFSSL
ncbi:hypothetical protein GCM10022258_34900 [Aquimarina gracilis]